MELVFFYGEMRMNENTAGNINEMEDIIWEKPEDESESQAPEIDVETDNENTVEPENPQETAPTLAKIVKKIDNLPNDFLDAYPIIKSDIFPIIADLGKGRQTYFKDLLMDKLKVKIRVINESLKEYIQEREKELSADDNPDLEEEEVFEREIVEQAELLASDPQIFKKRIDMVNDLGVVNERRNAGMIGLTLDSRLNPMGRKADVLALKITGEKGSGKTEVLLAVKELYPKKSYHMLNNASAKSLFNMGSDSISHTAIILNEAYAVQSNNTADTEFAHNLRCLISEGKLTYQYTAYDESGNKITKFQTVYGPTPLITTSIYKSLEQQLDDRMFSVHPDTSSKQTKEIILKRVQLKYGLSEKDFEKSIQTWRAFHSSLDIREVFIPFEQKLSIFITKGEELPVSARRAFERVITSINTITLLHQKQRQQDDQGRFIAEVQDYAIAYQLIEEAFRESLGEGKYTDRRIQLIDRIGPVAPRDLAKREGVSVPAITSWLKNWLEKGVVIWSDDQGSTINAKDLKKMKHSGKAYLKVVGLNRLPTPFELTGDDRWDVGGDLYQLYNLELDSGEDVIGDIGVNPDDQDGFNSDSDSEPVDNGGDEDDGDSGVKELNHRTQDEVKELVRESIRKQKEEYIPDDAKTQELNEEFSEFFEPIDFELLKERAEKRCNNHGAADDIFDGMTSV